MPFKYIIGQNSGDSHQASPCWLGLIVRFRDVVSFDRSKIKIGDDTGEMDISLGDSLKDPAAERDPIILTDQIVSWSTTSSKASHTSTANFSLAAGDIRLEYQLNAGDWLMFWAFDNDGDFNRVYANVRSGLGQSKTFLGAVLGNGVFKGDNQAPQVVNAFMDGLKFVGRINAPKRTRSVEPMTGKMKTSYEMTAVGFGEFDSIIHFDEAARARDASNQVREIAQNSQIGSDIGSEKTLSAELDAAVSNQQPLTSEDHIKKWLGIYLGIGPSQYSKGVTEEGVSIPLSGNDKFLVPISVGNLLTGSGAQTVYTYADLLQVFLGVQGPGNLDKSVSRDQALTLTPAAGFAFSKKSKLLGSFFSSYLDFSQSPVWDLLERFLNHPMNEMYVTLRIDINGRVRPTLVARQLPFSSASSFSIRRLIPDVKTVDEKPVFVRAQFDEDPRNRAQYSESPRGKIAVPSTSLQDIQYELSNFLDLPRWVLSSNMVRSEKLGPSESLRFNYIKVPGTDIVGDSHAPYQDTDLALNPPILVAADIQRNGLRTYIQPTKADVNGIVDQKGNQGRIFTSIMADILIDQHLKWTGTIDAIGIQEPIAIGDNLEYDDLILHIESVVHSGFIDMGGQKHFSTQLSLSHGVSIESDNTSPRRVILPGELVRQESPTINTERYVDPITGKPFQGDVG